MVKTLKITTSLSQMVEIVDTLAELAANSPANEELEGLLHGFEAIEDAICKIYEVQGLDPWLKENNSASTEVTLPKTAKEVSLPNWDIELLHQQATIALQETKGTPKTSKRAVLQMALLAFENACSAMEYTQADQVSIDLHNITPQGKTHNLKGYSIMLNQ
jgi:hypothetical protein